MEDQGLAIKHEDQGQRIMQSPARLATARRRLRGLAWGLQWEIMEDLQRSRYIQLNWGAARRGWNLTKSWWMIELQAERKQRLMIHQSSEESALYYKQYRKPCQVLCHLHGWQKSSNSSTFTKIVSVLTSKNRSETLSLKRYWVPKQIQVGCCCWPCVHLNAKKPDPNK